jgi:hypothetical protein
MEDCGIADCAWRGVHVLSSADVVFPATVIALGTRQRKT